MINNLIFQKLDLSGVKILVQWAQEEGWNPGPHDAGVFYETDSDGFYGYFSEGELIGGGSVVSYNREFGFMGFFIIKPEYRSHGIGKKLWYQRRDTLLSRLNKGAAIGMDGVIALQPFYNKGGFEIAFRDERFEKTGSEFEIDKNISSIKDNDFEIVLDYDKLCFGFSRPQFLKPWLKIPGNKTFKYTEDEKIKGFAIMRKAFIGYKVCPLFADNPEIAEELYKACLNSAKDEKVYLDIPVINQCAVDLVKKYDAQYVFECARMYHGKPPVMEIDKVFGITTFELG